MSNFWSSCFNKARYFSSSIFFFIVISFFILLRAYTSLTDAAYLLLRNLSNFAFEPFGLDPLLEHGYFIFVEGLDVVNHTPLLLLLLLLSLPELPLLLQQFVLLQVARQFVHLLTQPDLLRIPFVHQRLLLVQQFLFKLLLAQLDQFSLALHLSFLPLLHLLLISSFVLSFVLLLFQQSLVLTLLLLNALQRFFIAFSESLRLVCMVKVSKSLLSLGHVFS
jgi:hypothetical protein